MEIARKVMDCIRVTTMTIVMIMINVFGSLYILDEIMWDEDAALIVFWLWFIASTYKFVMMEIEDMKRIIKR